jgi:queuine tRNA-ribosyltransferase
MLKEIRVAIDEDRFEQYRKDFLEKFHQGVK